MDYIILSGTPGLSTCIQQPEGIWYKKQPINIKRKNISVCHHQYISPRTQQKPSGLATREKKQKNKKTKNVFFIKVSLHAITNQQNKIKHKEYSRRPLGMVNILEDKPVRKHPGCF